jgi:hypothetical protein
MSRLRVSVGFTLAVLCILFSFAAFAQEATKVNVFHINQEGVWTSGLKLRSATGGEFPVSDYGSIVHPVTLNPGGLALVENLPGILCHGEPLAGVVTFEVPAGAAVEYASRLDFNDGVNRNTLIVPSLPDASPVGSTVRLEGLENSGDFVSFLAFYLPDSATRAKLTFYDEQNSEFASNTINLEPGFRFYQVPVPFALGSVTVENIGSGIGGIGGAGGGPFFVFATSGRIVGGSPEVILP